MTAHCERDDNTDEVEITPEMIRAGISEYVLFDSADSAHWVVPAVFRAMLGAIEDQDYIHRLWMHCRHSQASALKKQLIEKEGFSELSDSIGQSGAILTRAGLE